jgi:large subunit ribosomal protein L34
MFLKNSFLTDFLGEINLIFTQEEYSSEARDFLYPLKNFFLSQQDILSFSISKYVGGDARLALLCEWYFESFVLTLQPQTLIQENQLYLEKRLPVDIRQDERAIREVENLIETYYIPMQLRFLHHKEREIVYDVVLRYPFLNKYLNNQFLYHSVSSELATHSRVLKNDITASQYLGFQAARKSFLLIGLPCILSFAYIFNEPDTIYNSKALKWSLLEDIARSISLLHETSATVDYLLFLSTKQMDAKARLEWLTLSRSEQFARAYGNPELMNEFKTMREKVHKQLNSNLNELVFPEQCFLTKREFLLLTYHYMIATYQPKTKQRRRKTGFRARLKTRTGLLVLKRRRLKGRWKLAV